MGSPCHQMLTSTVRARALLLRFGEVTGVHTLHDLSTVHSDYPAVFASMKQLLPLVVGDALRKQQFNTA